MNRDEIFDFRRSVLFQTEKDPTGTWDGRYKLKKIQDIQKFRFESTEPINMY